MKKSEDIIKWGRIKPYFDKLYNFNTIDIETVDNELFIFGYTDSGKYKYTLGNFFDNFHQFLIRCVQTNKDVLTWSRYDNTHLIKLIFSQFKDSDFIKNRLLYVGKISPIITYQYKSFTFVLENIIKDSIIFKINDSQGFSKRIVIYNLKNLYVTDLETTSKHYKIDYYSKLGKEYHIIDPKRFKSDSYYRKMTLYSNELDNKVLLDIASKFLENFRSITGVYPKSIFTAGSIARSYLLAKRKEIDVSNLNFRSIYRKNKYHDGLLDYSMRSYHGGKIESYVIGYIPNAKIIDITSAYPYALSKLPKLTNKVIAIKGNEDIPLINNSFYAFIRCNIIIKDPSFIHPLIVRSPINLSNISPYGYIKNIVITKPEYDYLIDNGVKIDVLDGYIIEHENDYPYKNLIDMLFQQRMDNKDNKAISGLFKTIINSLYGITYELTDQYELVNDEIEWKGYRAGDFFNPIIASYITSIIRTYLSDVSYDIVKNGGDVFLNMTDSIIYKGDVSLDVFSKKKILGKFEPPELIEDVIILGAGRYEYKDSLNSQYTIKNRGFSVSVKDKAFYKDIDLNSKIKITNKNFITMYKSTTSKYGFNKLGHLIDDEYSINPFNLGGKRIIDNYNINLNKDYTKTKPVYLDKYLEL